MPECPEVCITAQYLLTHIKNKTILKLTSKKKLGISVVGYTVQNIDSKGKLLWFELTNKDKMAYIICHFGLTGEWSLNDNNHKVCIEFTDNSKIYYNDDRGFGKINITSNYNTLQSRQNKISPDLLKTDFTERQFLDTFKVYLNKTKRRNKMLLVKLLMDQHGIGSGIGNYLSAEILYHAQLSPRRTLDSLSDTDIKKLAYSIKYIIKLSYYNNNTGYMTNFGDFISIHKEGIKKKIFPNYHSEIKFTNEEFTFNVYRQKTDKLGNKVIVDKIINNRSTYWVKELQK
jgi:formamidopyrimidine-DNA glycosylase